MIQKIRLANDGTCVAKRIQPYTGSDARVTPSIKVNRLKKLIEGKEPKVCIVRGEGIGDVIMTLPTVHALKTMFQKIDISYATNTNYLGGALQKVLLYNPDISEILERDLLEDSKYDLVINLHCPCIRYEKPGCSPLNRIDIFAKHVGVTLSNPVPSYYVQKEEVQWAEEKISHLQGQKLILVQASASTSRRSLDHRVLKTTLQGLFQQHNIVSLLVQHGSDYKSEVEWSAVPGVVPIKDLDIREIAAMMVHCDMVLCPDSSILHLAGALGVPTVSIFGPTHPAARVNHFPNAIAIWKGENYTPCPCWYQHLCPIGHACWSIEPDEIIDTCINHLQQTSKISIEKLLSKQEEVIIHTEII